jgi:hypothetical protein
MLGPLSASRYAAQLVKRVGFEASGTVLDSEAFQFIIWDLRGHKDEEERRGSRGDTEWLPPRFVLEDSGVRRQVAVAWQGAEHIGVRYLDQPPQRPAPIFGRRKS